MGGCRVDAALSCRCCRWAQWGMDRLRLLQDDRPRPACCLPVCPGAFKKIDGLEGSAIINHNLATRIQRIAVAPCARAGVLTRPGPPIDRSIDRAKTRRRARALDVGESSQRAPLWPMRTFSVVPRLRARDAFQPRSVPRDMLFWGERDREQGPDCLVCTCLTGGKGGRNGIVDTCRPRPARGPLIRHKRTWADGEGLGFAAALSIKASHPPTHTGSHLAKFALLIPGCVLDSQRGVLFEAGRGLFSRRAD